MANILVFAEQRDGKFNKASLAAVTVAKQLVEKAGGSYTIAVLGQGVDGVANEAAKFGAAKVIVADAAELAQPVPGVYASAVADLAKQIGATHVLASATTIGKEFMPRVAVKLGAGMVSELVEVEGAKAFKRLMWAGNVVARVEVATDVVVATVRAANFDRAAESGASPVEKATAAAGSTGTQFVKFAPTVSNRPQLTEAAVVVAGGRGLKDQERFDGLLGPLADTLGAAIGATRAVVDAGFVDNDLQVGQTGKVVAPDLYFGIGLSGAIQHLAGMKNSKTIVAINKDEEAPIFTVSDYGLVQDLFKVVPELTELIKAHKASA